MGGDSYTSAVPDEPAPLDKETPDDASVPTEEPELLAYGRYRIERQLGRGGMGRVLLAYDTKLHVWVAMKLVPEEMVTDAEAINDLRQEVLRGMSLMHPNIVRAHTLELDETGAAIIMEYIDGWTLTDVKEAQHGRCCDHEQILPWMESLGAVLDYAHTGPRIVHRDLKPRNLMLTQEGVLKVADFGIAATLSDTLTRHTGIGSTSGTPPFMSPQQAIGRKPSPADDIYALGATIYDLLTGKPPFFRGPSQGIMQQVLEQVPPTMAERRTELGVAEKDRIPPHWEKVVAACLEKDPARRPSTAGEVIERLHATSRRSSSGKREPALAGTKPWVWIVFAALGILASVGLYFAARTPSPMPPLATVTPAPVVIATATPAPATPEPVAISQPAATPEPVATPAPIAQEVPPAMPEVAATPPPATPVATPPPVATFVATPAPPISTGGPPLADTSLLELVLDAHPGTDSSGFATGDTSELLAEQLKGEYRIVTRKNGLLLTKASALQDLELRDFVCEIEARVAAIGNGGSWGIGLVRLTKPVRPWTGILMDSYGQVNTHSYESGPFLPWLRSAALGKAGQFNTLRFEARDRQFRLFVNNQYVGERTHERILPCCLVFFIHSSGVGFEMRVRAVRVWKPKS